MDRDPSLLLSLVADSLYTIWLYDLISEQVWTATPILSLTVRWFLPPALCALVFFPSWTTSRCVRLILCLIGGAEPVSTECSMSVKLPRSNSFWAKLSWYSLSRSISNVVWLWSYRELKCSRYSLNWPILRELGSLALTNHVKSVQNTQIVAL